MANMKEIVKGYRVQQNRTRDLKVKQEEIVSRKAELSKRLEEHSTRIAGAKARLSEAERLYSDTFDYAPVSEASRDLAAAESEGRIASEAVQRLINQLDQDSAAIDRNLQSSPARPPYKAMSAAFFSQNAKILGLWSYMLRSGYGRGATLDTICRHAEEYRGLMASDDEYAAMLEDLMDNA